ncbi:CCA tRNA nucleotidyltransferase [Lysinibacillus sp. SGAir0095]|uniref:CCA tRNA nucleotidyltransferase n=1 Tax=Lysinibacillus sp. SGAir0095 TaxID=2070463 RepID=UPI0010CD5858|nr:CCA tRNA nucleotidyltransferase [Lysinibacillus sp. SGAir0095]QCR32185.1 CCA tRNA nucleotidyltransferase [Lysinibacillus sp. SGAir0095]
MKVSNDWRVALRVIDRIEKSGFEAVIVGGAVRDHLLQRQINDVDVATSALPSEVKEIFSSTVDVGIEHGTVLVLDEGEPIEVTTYRTEGTYSDYRRPEEVAFVRNLEEDLQRRDFTINAMAFTKDGQIIDLFGGKEDIENKVIRAVGNPNVRFREDALRMLRAIRFSAQLGFSIEEETLKAIQIDSDLIDFIANERIAMEIAKIWKSKYVNYGLQLLIESNLTKYLVGNFAEQLDYWRTFKAEKSEVGWAYLCLLNRQEIQNIIDFYRLSNKEKNYIRSVLNAFDALRQKWTAMDYFSYELEILETAYHFARWQNVKLPFEKEDIQVVKNNLPIKSIEELAINGNHLMAWTTRKRGPWIKVALDAAIIAVLNGYVENDVDKLKEWFLNDFINEG